MLHQGHSVHQAVLQSKSWVLQSKSCVSVCRISFNVSKLGVKEILIAFQEIKVTISENLGITVYHTVKGIFYCYHIQFDQLLLILPIKWLCFATPFIQYFHPLTTMYVLARVKRCENLTEHVLHTKTVKLTQVQCWIPRFLLENSIGVKVLRYQDLSCFVLVSWCK